MDPQIIKPDLKKQESVNLFETINDFDLSSTFIDSYIENEDDSSLNGKLDDNFNVKQESKDELCWLSCFETPKLERASVLKYTKNNFDVTMMSPSLFDDKPVVAFSTPALSRHPTFFSANQLIIPPFDDVPVVQAKKNDQAVLNEPPLFSSFKTGAGVDLNISQSKLIKARKLIGLDDSPMTPIKRNFTPLMNKLTKKFSPPFRTKSKVQIKKDIKNNYGAFYSMKKTVQKISLHELSESLKRCRNFKDENMKFTNDSYFNLLKNIIDYESFEFNVDKSFLQKVDGKSYSLFLPTEKIHIFPRGFAVGKFEIADCFFRLVGGQNSGILEPWIFNHYKFIINKLVLLELRFPLKFFEKALSIDNVLSILKYRYDLEILQSHRSIIKRITEKDHGSMDRMILRVSNLFPICSYNINHEKIIELTDGHYPILASIDRDLSALIDKSIIKQNDKLLICNATICENISVGSDPLDAYGKVILKIEYNSVRRATSYTKLGLAYPKYPFLVPLSSVKPQGIVGSLQIYILRAYDPEFCEHHDDGSFIFRSYNEEANEKIKYQSLKQEESYSLYCGLINNSEKLSGETLSDPTPEQKIMEQLERRISDKFPSRKVSKLYCFKIFGLSDEYPPAEAYLYVWNPSQTIRDILKPKNKIKAFNLKAKSIQVFGIYHLKLCTTNSSSFIEIPKTQFHATSDFVKNMIYFENSQYEKVKTPICLNLIGIFTKVEKDYFLVDLESNKYQILDYSKKKKLCCLDADIFVSFEDLVLRNNQENSPIFYFTDISYISRDINDLMTEKLQNLKKYNHLIFTTLYLNF